MVSLLTLESEAVDWRRFLLSAALPWPLPSLAQLLLLRQRLRTVDTGATGSVTQDQYLQVGHHGRTHAHTCGRTHTHTHPHSLTITL